MQASTTLCRCQARINGEASQKTQPNISLKRGFYLLLFSSSYFFDFLNLYLDSCLNRLTFDVWRMGCIFLQQRPFKLYLAGIISYKSLFFALNSTRFTFVIVQLLLGSSCYFTERKVRSVVIFILYYFFLLEVHNSVAPYLCKSLIRASTICHFLGLS